MAENSNIEISSQMKPKAFKYWPDYAQDAYNEREAIMREANNIPDADPTPLPIIAIAAQAAQNEIELAKPIKRK